LLRNLESFLVDLRNEGLAGAPQHSVFIPWRFSACRFCLFVSACFLDEPGTGE
jgi:hypothetical protein